jgi:hypothetical protein
MFPFTLLSIGMILLRVETSPVPPKKGAFYVFGDDISSLLRIIQWKLLDDDKALRELFFKRNCEMVRQLLCVKIPKTKWYVSMVQVTDSITVHKLTKDFTAEMWCKSKGIPYHTDEYDMWANMNPDYNCHSWVSLIGSHPTAICDEIFLHNPSEVVEKVVNLSIVDVFFNFRREISTIIPDIEKRKRWLDEIANPETCNHAMAEILAKHL